MPGAPDDHADADATRRPGESLGARDPTGWFERLYAAAAAGEAVVPWSRGAPRELLVEWARARGLRGGGQRAIVVGCGLGDDAEFVAGLGFDTDAFDVSPTAVATARRRFPASRVRYRAADLLEPPPEWRRTFDLVVECLTVQSLPEPERGRAIARVSGLVAPGGTLIVVASGRDELEVPDGPPWPLTRSEVEAFATGGLALVRAEAIRGDDPQLRWRAEFRRPGSGGPAARQRAKSTV
jgi:SAM-dependent methyltransferase